MKPRRLWQAVLLGSVFYAVAVPVLAQQSVKIGVLSDLAGPYRDSTGPGSVIATRMAVEDFIAAEHPGFQIEIVVGDHQNKADIAASKAREWFEKDGVDVITDLINSSVALAVSKIANEKNKIAMVTGAATNRLTNEDCNAVTVHWTYDSYSIAIGTAQSLTRMGKKNWFFITADYAFGHSLEKDSQTVIEANGGKILGRVRHPFPGTDFSSLLLTAQASGAQVIGLANAGTDLTNTIKQAGEFGITDKQDLAGLALVISYVHALGLEVAQNLYVTEGFYWDLNDQTRAWSRRFFARHQQMPNMYQAGQYSLVYHYLKSVKAAGSRETTQVMEKIRALPVDDFFAPGGRVRADGRMVHDMYLLQVKQPTDSKEPWDYYHVRATIPAADAFLPLEKSICPLVRK